MDNIDPCPICGRQLDGTTDQHHLTPKTHNGVEKVRLHRICHEMIHATFDHHELAGYYHTIDRLLDHPQIAKFAKWAAKRPYNFYDRMKRSNRRK